MRYRTAAITASGGSATTDGDYTVRTFSSNATLQLTSYTRAVFVSQVVEHTFPNTVGRMRDVFFKADGTRLWAVTDEEIVQYDFETPWDVATLEPSTARFAPGTPYGVYITPDGAHALVTFAASIARYPLLTSGSTILSAKEHAIIEPAAENYSEAAFDQIALTGTDAFFQLTDDTSLATGDCLRIARKLSFDADEKIDSIAARFTETVVNGGYDLKVSIVADNDGEPTGAVIASATKAIAAADVGSGSAIFFQLDDPITLGASLDYWVIFEVADYDDIDATENVRLIAYQDTGADVLRVYTAADGWISTGFEGTTEPQDADIPLKIFLSDPQGDDAATEEETVKYVYFAVEKLLYRIPVAHLADFDTATRRVGAFKNGHATHHPMTIQNLSLFVGDASVIASVDAVGGFASETELNVPRTETITALTPFDTDVLIGTKDYGFGRVLRWDTTSPSWSAQDEVYDDEGVSAFMHDDNYVYVAAGQFGRIYFYNGEKMEPYIQIPGEWSPTQKAVIHPNAVGFWLNMPVFGLSNVSGNPQLQGVYGLGAYNTRGYEKTLSLDFPISAGTFEGVTVGAILVKGADMWVAWKTASAVGVDKLDYTAKYASAYIETVVLNVRDEKASLRHRIKTLGGVAMPYATLPTDTTIAVSYKKKNEASYTALETAKRTNDEDRQLLQYRQSVPKVAAPQLRLDFTVSANATPELQDCLYDVTTPE